ncbi:MAG: hypothetical protein ACR2JU_01660 [Nocardioidaceae bacterium]
MQLAAGKRLGEVLARLALLRPVFHSEADFQQAFAWEARALDPSLHVRLETRPAPGVRLDLLLRSEDGTAQTAIELKYLVRLWHGDVAGERFELKNQGAQDIRAYDVVKDIVRVEQFVANRPGSNGAVVCLTNESSYWRASGHGRQTNADAFRLHDGTVLEGKRAWGPATGPGSSKGRETPLVLRGRYQVAWRTYSSLAGIAGEFRSLVVPVDS